MSHFLSGRQICSALTLPAMMAPPLGGSGLDGRHGWCILITGAMPFIDATTLHFLLSCQLTEFAIARHPGET